MPSLHSNRGAKRAREARAALGLDLGAPLSCLLDVVEDVVGLPVVIATLLDGLAGACVPLGPTRLLFVNGTEPRVRQRFTLAHELGHHWCGHDGGMVIDTIETVAGKTTTPYENEANAFAAEFLIPKVALTGRFAGDPTPDDVLTLAAEYGTSGVMTHFRLRQCGLITEAASAAFHAADHGAAWERLGLAGYPDRIARIAQLPYLSPRLESTHLGAAVRGDAAADSRLAVALARLLAPSS
ncbi:ImmA/IrrE family metallo-endopeptidase [Paraconexibacter sp. AEG42_29]|uniref:ImmA/IrrE family metallo-endopeptidase n=1 Tax=Paraconexibacter sp. AEG42_29 TaxID=2997339 RepID=UPI00339D65B9